MVKVVIQSDYWEMSRDAAEIIANQIINKPDSVIGLATGSTPIGMYDELIRMFKRGLINFSKVVTFNLDEYWPMPRNSPYSYHFYMKYYFFNHVNIKEENIHIPNGEVEISKINEYCEWYEDEIKAHGGIDLQILGIGGGYYNEDGKYIGGHIGFNEPGSSFNSRTRLVKLSEQTRSDNSRFFMRIEEVPYYAITMGIATIMEAKKIILLASGEHKASSVKEALEGEITNLVPASILQKHPNTIFILDRGAASKLKRTVMPWLYSKVDWTFELKKALGKEENLLEKALTLTAIELKKRIIELNVEDLKYMKLEELASYNLDFLKQNVISILESKIVDENKLPKDKRILIFSPHPDDDVICIGATMKILNDTGNDVRVAYMVSGNIAVRDSDVIEEIDELIENGESLSKIINDIKNGSIELKKLLDLKAKIREREACKAAEILGIKRDKLYFLRLPFYESGVIIKNPITNADIEIVMKLLNEIKPEIIVMPGEVDDPHGTHGKCIEIILEALKRTFTKHESKIWLYKGSWEEYMIYEADMIIPFNEELMNKKIEAIKMHKSQLTPLFQGLDPRPFWKRALDRNRINGRLLNIIGLTDEKYAELIRFKNIRDVLNK